MKTTFDLDFLIYTKLVKQHGYAYNKETKRSCHLTTSLCLIINLLKRLLENVNIFLKKNRLQYIDKRRPLYILELILKSKI